MSENSVEKMIIIGSGPAGYTAALYTARANLSPLLITGNEIGGQVAITYEVENYPGFPESLTGPELVEKFQQQAEKFGARIEYDYVSEVDFRQHPFVVRTASEKEYRAESGNSCRTRVTLYHSSVHPRFHCSVCSRCTVCGGAEVVRTLL